MANNEHEIIASRRLGGEEVTGEVIGSSTPGGGGTPVACVVSRDAGGAVLALGDVPLEWDNELVDTGGWFDLANPDIFTVPEDGWYEFSVVLQMSPALAGDGIFIYFTVDPNGAPEYPVPWGEAPAGRGGATASGVVQLSEGDEIQIVVGTDTTQVAIHGQFSIRKVELA